MKVLKCLKHPDSCLKCFRACMIGIIRPSPNRQWVSGHYSTQEVIFLADAVHTVRVLLLLVIIISCSNRLYVLVSRILRGLGPLGPYIQRPKLVLE